MIPPSGKCLILKVVPCPWFRRNCADLSVTSWQHRQTDKKYRTQTKV